MSIPGLQLAAPVEAAAPNEHELKAGSEWRFEVGFGEKIRVKLLSGNAELFGTELAPSQSYTFTATKAAIYTWQGCRIEVSGQCQVEYTAEETPMVSYANAHFALEHLRQASEQSGKEGPRVLVVGPENAGKTTLVKILTAYGTKSGKQPLIVNMDTREGLLSVPGSLTATSFASIVDVEDGWGSTPTSGPSPVPVKLPLVYYYPLPSPEDYPKLFKPISTRLALAVTSKLADDPEAKKAGCIIDTPGIISQGKGGYDLIQHVVSEFSVNVIFILGSERLYSDMVRRFDKKKTSTDELISVIKLDKSGGCVDRDDAFMKQMRQNQIRTYFFGDARTTLSPHTQMVDYSQMTIFKLQELDTVNLSLLPGGAEDDGAAPPIFEKMEPTPMMQNAILAIMHANTNDAEEDIRDASVMGFVYVADVDEKKRKVKVLAPVSGRLPAKPFIWGSWPEGPSDLVA